MNTLAALLDALHASPADDLAWLALADWLEENDRLAQAELLRLHRSLRNPSGEGEHTDAVARIRHLLLRGVRPVWPTCTNAIGMELSLIPPGNFWMGAAIEEPEQESREGPVHEVEITRPFYLGCWPVTQKEYEQVMGNNPAEFRLRGRARGNRDRFPVENVSWFDAVRFCERLSALPEEKAQGRRYRLPSEAEWEYACRAWLGNDPFWLGATLSLDQACFRSPEPFARQPPGPERNQPCPVASFAPNPFALYDVHGGIWEWCADWYDEEYYHRSPPRDPAGPETGHERAQRGGCFGAIAGYCRSACREMDVPELAQASVGFRVAMTVDVPVSRAALARGSRRPRRDAPPPPR